MRRSMGGKVRAREIPAVAAEKIAPLTYVIHGPYEIKPRIVAALKGYQQWNGFNEEIGRHINLAMLEYEKGQF